MSYVYLVLLITLSVDSVSFPLAFFGFVLKVFVERHISCRTLEAEASRLYA